MDARIPFFDPDTGRGDLRRVVSVSGIPRGPGALDDNVRIVVDLPPGSGDGPMVTPTLGVWGVRSAAAYNALLNLAYRWFVPGVTRYPVRGGRHWLQSQDPERYPELSDADVVNITRPLSARTAKRNLVADGWATLRALEESGELRIVGRRALPTCHACQMLTPTPTIQRHSKTMLHPVQKALLARAESIVSPCTLATSP